MFSSKKITYVWLFGTIVLTVTGYMLAWHGAVYAESADRIAMSADSYLVEVEIGKILLWPTMLISYTTDYKNMNIIELVFFQLLGYFLVIKLLDKFIIRKHNKSFKSGTPKSGAP